MGYPPYGYFSGTYLKHQADVAMKMPHENDMNLNIDLQQNLKISGFPVVMSLQAPPHRQILVSLVNLNLKRAASDQRPHSRASENALYKNLVAGQPI